MDRINIEWKSEPQIIKRKASEPKFHKGDKLKAKINQELVDKEGLKRNYLNVEITAYAFNEAFGIHIYSVKVEGSLHDVVMDEKTLIEMVGC